MATRRGTVHALRARATSMHARDSRHTGLMGKRRYHRRQCQAPIVVD